uniref:Uncharacterized protein n=1 Tax=Anticarsia gemmatalis multiple nucleopolyhedrovirus TaxID=268591 RepID=A0A0S3IW56_9ABAC|nr:hypothetical protein AGNV_008 [Anticarsia gemmatalis multiple nucleopolyhedrovirus]ALR70131.1 hypothetical protein AGNV_008 [Anticarsia gemmatalis multiple nucleopolyhedrovirus]ALR70288.1 hypothetical protein AGNV_008 [Anticarsia gemmatalis multiple nucleopolyhedrovirus]ALR70601.1 hypothetical protein AGNV_008 [Anticarsia gemmatalis multiple nucleopolyhedrovirus]ALR71073.1 hypothetical protein AGNV_008 [Anticarsia gemmatalis multiple nucleopolyhedrovirus]
MYIYFLFITINITCFTSFIVLVKPRGSADSCLKLTFRVLYVKPSQ